MLGKAVYQQYRSTFAGTGPDSGIRSVQVSGKSFVLTHSSVACSLGTDNSNNVLKKVSGTLATTPEHGALCPAGEFQHHS